MIEPIKGTESSDPRSQSRELESILSQSITISKEVPYPNSLQLKDQWFNVGGEKFYYSLGEMKPLLEAYIALREREARIDELESIKVEYEQAEVHTPSGALRALFDSVDDRLNELKKGEDHEST